MTRKMLLALAGAALAGGIATTSAQAAPISNPLTTIAASGVQQVHYNDGWRRKPWWYYNRWDRRDHRPWWWHNHYRRSWSWNNNHRRDRDHDRYDRDRNDRRGNWNGWNR